MDLGLRDRVFIVTGGSRGLGRGAAQALVGEGARVVLGSRSPEIAAAEIAAAVSGEEVVPVAADNADPATPGRLIAAAHETFDRLDGALISVGGPPPGPASAVTEEQWRSAFETVFLGAVRLARAVVDALRDGDGDGITGEGGSIAFVLSSSVRSPITGLAISNGLRPGLAGFAKTLADEAGPYGIRVNGLLPGRFATERVRELDAARGTGPDEAARRIPLGRDGRPGEFGRVAAFLLSPAASYISGVMLPVDGGALRAL